MRRVMGVCIFILLTASSAQAQQKKLKVLISADMEGVGGVSAWDVQADSKGREYEQFRRLMTLEVNAAIAGAADAGATEFLVVESHSGWDIDMELLDKRARLIRGWPRPLDMVQGIDSTFDAVVFVGYHAREGAAEAVLAHTDTGTIVVKLNGVEVPEAGFNAAIAGDFGVPVVFLSGDQTACQEARALLGPIETAEVKHAIGFYSAEMLPPNESQRLIREGVRRGVERRAEIKPYKISHPVKLEIRFNDVVVAEVASYLPGVERPSGNTIAFTGRDMTEVSKFITAVEYLKVRRNDE
ncbi:MAG TPA: M55 family metallopeptidase [Candidatus Sulfotelmatobacter sp.]|nr:M55 family metallopeptidase [Candidatus Sulfotelmatobacter sp.]